MRPPPYLTSPWPEPFPPRWRPAVALRALADQLQRRGITSLYGYACDRIGVLSLPTARHCFFVAGLRSAVVGRQDAHDVVNQEIWAVDRTGPWWLSGMFLISQSET
jgi:hypothetical protein